MNTLQFTAKAIVSALLIGGASIISSCSGDDGADGVTPECKDGTWHNGKKDTGTSCVGQDGQSGQSVPPTCVDGTWHNGTTDTGVSCVGQDGQTGSGTAPTCVDGTWHNGTVDTEIPCAAVAEGCDVKEAGAYFVMECGGVEKAKWAKALCAGTAYDPLFERCEGTELKSLIAKIGELNWLTEPIKKDTVNKFTWDDAMTVCPDGWRLPSKDEVDEDKDEVSKIISYYQYTWTSTESEEADTAAYRFHTTPLPANPFVISTFAKDSEFLVLCVKE